MYSLDIETVGFNGKPCLDWWQGSILCVGLYDGKTAQSIDFNIQVLNELFGNPNNEIVLWNALYDLTWLKYYGVTEFKAKIYDAMLLYQLLFNKENLDCSLRASAKQFLQMDILDIKNCQLKDKNKQDVEATYKVWNILCSILDKQDNRQVIWKYFSELLMPVVNVFIDVQLRGVKIDVDKINSLIIDYKNKVDKAKLNLCKSIGNVNPSSPKQLSQYLFERLKLKPIKEKNKSGYYPVDEETLQELANSSEVVKEILGLRKQEKILSSLRSIKESINSQTGRIYPKYNMVSSVSGRICANDPNLQNIDSSLRSIVVPEKGYKLLKNDLSQIELRILAHLSKDSKLCEVFHKGLDLHQMTADLLGVDRKVGKTINFGIIYGMGPRSLAKQLNIKEEQAKEFIDKVFETYKDVKQYIDNVSLGVKQLKYSTTIFGRRRYFVDIDNHQLRAGFNHQIQGSCADLMLLILRNVHRELKHGYIIGQVFDELLLEVEENYVNEVKEMVRNKMVNLNIQPRLQVPIEVTQQVLECWR